MLNNILENGFSFVWELPRNPTKLKIIKILMEKENLNVSEIQKILEANGEKFNYKTIWQHIKDMDRLSLIFLNKEGHDPGKPNKVNLSKSIKENKIEVEKFLIWVLENETAVLKKKLSDNKKLLKELNK